MEMIEMSIDYAGAPAEITIYPEENFLGMTYPVESEGKYLFTLFFNEDEEWSILREPNGITPEVDNELLKKILKNLQHQLKYAA